MSGLAYLSGYGSDSDIGESDIEQKVLKPKLPVPKLNHIAFVSTDEGHRDDPSLHSGRIRSFPHERGNWATFVFVKYCTIDELEPLIKQLKKYILNCSVDDCFVTEDFHVSVSRTVVLKFHQINSFIKSLQEAVSDLSSFELGFSGVKVYCNEEKTRTFLSLEVDFYSQRYLKKIVEKVDETLLEYKLPTFYDNPSFHMSILWLNGDKKAEIEKILPELNRVVTQEIGKSLKTVIVEKIHCKSGNKLFQFSLD